ncbi:MAG: alcohol dehydrogenase AdhP, partial [Alkalispirochaetaceae bacterium]
KPLDIEEHPVPRPEDGEVLVKIEASGVCHTDLHAAEGDWPVKPKLPLIPGHEGVGYVAAVGKGVTNVKEGDAVGVPWLYSACGECEYCQTGWETLCEKQQNGGYSVDGGYAQYTIANATYVGRLPKDTDFPTMAPILCAGVTTYKGIKVTDTKPGEWIAIFGIGGLGHVAVQYAKAMGRLVYAVDVADDKLELAKKLGADAVCNAKQEDPGEKARREFGGAHGVVVTAVSPVAFRQALDVCRRGATVAMNGLPPGEFGLPIFDVILNGITLRGSIVGTRKDLQESIDFASRGWVKPSVAVEPLENINDIFSRMHQGKIEGRIVLSMD